MEVFLRLNDDCEKDYCFEVEKTDTINERLAKLFDPKEGVAKYMNFKPSIFHQKQPSSFNKSVHPGYLTINGTILFDYDCDKKEFLEPLIGDKVTIVDQVWPHQLILPKWDLDYFAVGTFFTIMVVWIYTDLPDFISPTPGICLTNNLSRVVRWWAIKDGRVGLAEKLTKEIQVNGTKQWLQILFFVIHCFKILIITFFFKIGMINPITFNPYYYYSNIYKKTSLQMETLKNKLHQFGWVGIKRLTFDEYFSVFHNELIKKAGGTVQAYKLGYYKFLKNPGTKLSKSEGFDTPLAQRFDAKHQTFKVLQEDKKFQLSQEYYMELEKTLQKLILEIEESEESTYTVAVTDPSSQKITYETRNVVDMEKYKKIQVVDLLKNFRKFGFFELPKEDETSEGACRLKKIFETLDEAKATAKAEDLKSKKNK